MRTSVRGVLSIVVAMILVAAPMGTAFLANATGDDSSSSGEEKPEGGDTPTPEPTDPEPTAPEPTEPDPTHPEPTEPEPTEPQPTEPEPTDPEPTDPGDPQPVPAIKLDKTASEVKDLDGNGHDVGDTITYSFKVSNTGNTTLTEVKITDPKVGAVKCPTTTLGAGQSVDCTPVTYVLTVEDVAAGKVHNVAKVEGTGPSGSYVTDEDDTTTEVEPGSVSVGDFVWIDVDGDGVQEAGEPGIAGVTVTIVGPGDLSRSTTTDGSGKYVFDELPVLEPGESYTVAVDNGQPALDGFTPTQTGQGSAATDSSTGSAESGDLTDAGDSDTTLDFGYVRPGASIELDKVAGEVEDLDGNGTDVGDTIEYTFEVTNTGDVPLTDITVSDPKVGAVTCPSGTLAPGASIDCDPVTYSLTAADLAAGEVINKATATGTDPNGDDVSDDDETKTPTKQGSVSVGDFVWLDTDRDGSQDAGEPGLQGVIMTIVGPDGQQIDSATTDENGQYLFEDLPVLPAGQSYTVQVDNSQDALADYVPTQAGVGDPALDSSTGSAESGDVSEDGAFDPTLDFGYVTDDPAILLDKVAAPLDDVDGNGPTVGDTITFSFKVTNVGGAVLDPVVVTDPMVGDIACPTAPLAPGDSFSCDAVTYELTEDDLNSGSVDNTATATGIAPDGDDVSDDDSTSTPLTVEVVGVGDFVWFDENGNGIQDDGEPGIEGVELTLVGPDGQPVTNVDGDPVGPAVTDGTGFYLFPGLPALEEGESYTVQIDNDQPALSGYTPTQSGQGTPATDSSTGEAASGDLTESGDRDLTLDFGFVQATTPDPAITLDKIAGQIDDLDGNGHDVGDTIDYTFVVTNTGGVTLDPVTVVDPKVGAVTCPTGRLAAGDEIECGPVTYTLTASDVAAGSVDNTAVATGTPPSGPPVTDDDETSTPVDPSTGGVSVGDYVWIDQDRDGVQDANEAGIPGVVLTLVGPDGEPARDLNGNLVAPVTTDAAGKYQFTGLPPLPAGQHYTVRIDNSQPALSQYRPTQTGQGTPATDSANGAAESGDLTTAGQSDNTLDFGYISMTDTTPAISLDKQAGEIVDADGNGHDAGDTITYTFVVTNTGGRDLSDVTVTDPKLGRITCPSTTLDVGQSMTCTAAPYVIIAAEVKAGTVLNTAIATGVPTPEGPTEPTPPPVTDDDSTETPVDPGEEPPGPNPPGPNPPGPNPPGSNPPGGEDSVWYPSGDWLPETGGPAALVMWVGAGLLLGGTALVGRKRRTN